MTLLDNARYILRELSNTRSPKLEYDPASRQMLLLGVVRYPFDIACVAVGGDRHVGRVWSFFNWMKGDSLLVWDGCQGYSYSLELSVLVTWCRLRDFLEVTRGGALTLLLSAVGG